MYKFAISRPITTLMLSLMVVFFGILGFNKLKTALLPDVDFPVLLVYTAYPGASPEVVESKVTNRIESAINGIDGIKNITSQSYKGISVVVIEFDLSKQINEALNDVNAKLQSVRFDSNDVKQPTIRKFDNDSRSIVSLFVTNKNGDVKKLMRDIDLVIAPKLERVEGVGGVSASGFRKREIKLFVDPNSLNRYHITYLALNRALESSNLRIGVGSVDKNGKEYLLTIDDGSKSVEEIGKIRIADGVILKDVATIKDELQDKTSFASYGNGDLITNDGVILDIKKIAKANEIKISDGIRDAIKELEIQLPDIQIFPYHDTTDYIRDAISDVEFDLLFGGALAVGVVLLFLRDFRITIVSALSLPVSLLGTLAVISAFGYTLNMLTLMALTLSIGIIIDDAIVVIENIHKKVESKMPPRAAAYFGAKEIAFTIVAISFMLLAVFIPIGNMSGIIGRFFANFGITIAVAIVVSYFVVLTLIPMASSILLTSKPTVFYTKTLPFFTKLENGYEGFLKFALKYKAIFTGAIIALFIGSIFVAKSLGGTFILQEDKSEFNISVRGPDNTAIEAMSEIMTSLQREVLKDKNVKYATAQVGFGRRSSSNRGMLYVKLVEPKDRKLSQFEIQRKMEEHLRTLPISKDVRIFSSEIDLVSGTNESSNFRMTIYGQSQKALDDSIENFEKFLESNPKLKGKTTNFRTNDIDNNKQYKVIINHVLADKYGISAVQIAQALQNGLSTDANVSNFYDEGRAYDIILRAKGKATLDTLDKIQVSNKYGQLMFITSLVNLEPYSSLDSIVHYNGQRSIDVFLDIKKGISLQDVISEISKDKSWLADGANFQLSGDSQNTKEAQASFGTAISIAVVLIYLILAGLYESFIFPFIIMLTMPLSFMGAFFALKLDSQPFSLFSFMGLILLLGIVGKNATLLLDVANTRRMHSGKSGKEAIIESILYAGKSRLRPILMTTIAMIFGMLPLAISTGAGEAMKSPIGISMIGGLTISMILSLIIVPIFYVLLARADDWLKKFYASSKPLSDYDLEFKNL